MEQTDNVEDLLKVEQRLAEVRGEIEQLQGRLNVLENRIALATINVLLHAPPDLSVVLAAENLPVAHEVTTFALTYRNSGSVTARDGLLVFRVPEFLSVIGIGHGGAYEPLSREIRWSLADIAPGSVNSVYAHCAWSLQKTISSCTPTSSRRARSWTTRIIPPSLRYHLRRTSLCRSTLPHQGRKGAPYPSGYL